MPMIKKHITVTDQQEEWIKSQMASGKYGTDSELIREALREKQMRMNEIDYIRAKLIEAEKGGFSKRTADEILTKSKAEMLRNG